MCVFCAPLVGTVSCVLTSEVLFRLFSKGYDYEERQEPTMQMGIKPLPAILHAGCIESSNSGFRRRDCEDPLLRTPELMSSVCAGVMHRINANSIIHGLHSLRLLVDPLKTERSLGNRFMNLFFFLTLAFVFAVMRSAFLPDSLCV